MNSFIGPDGRLYVYVTVHSTASHTVSWSKAQSPTEWEVDAAVRYAAAVEANDAAEFPPMSERWPFDRCPA